MIRKLSNQEITTILAGLRLLQHEGGFPEYFADAGCRPLTKTKIDSLCDHLNAKDTYILSGEAINLPDKLQAIYSTLYDAAREWEDAHSYVTIEDDKTSLDAKVTEADELAQLVRRSIEEDES